MKKLKKELTLLDVYSIATGTTLSGGFFLLPGIAAAQAGPAMILSYVLAAIPFIPAMICLAELSTAMPRAGGVYYFLDRSMGPVMGTIGGFGTWLSLILKTAFALVGMGAYLSLFVSGDYLTVIAIGFALFFGVVNLAGAKETGFIQALLSGGILAVLIGFIGKGVVNINTQHFEGFFDAGQTAILSTAGLVYFSYIGVTKIASISEEVKDPEKNIPLGMFLSFATAIVIYVLGIYVMIGILPNDELINNLTPVASTADSLVGKWGKILVTIAAVFAFSSVTNAGILSASRYPLAMSRDHLISKQFRKLNKKGIPVNGVIITVVLTIFIIVVFDPTKIAKLASAFQLLMFALCCLTVIIMRESHIEAYDPGYRAPFYPWLPILGILSSFFLIFEMGTLSILFSLGLILLSVWWFYYYARVRVARGGAILHVFERLGSHRHIGLEQELRSIMKEKGLRDHDPFDELVARAQVIDLEHCVRFDEIIRQASELLAEKVSYPAEKIEKEIRDGTKVGGTPVSSGVALPHMRLHHIVEPELLIVRAKNGVDLEIGDDFWGEHKPDCDINALFFLVSPEENPQQHLRILAKIAGRVDDEGFLVEWNAAMNEQNLKGILIRDERFMALVLRKDKKSGSLIGKKIRELNMPDGCLVAIIHREGMGIIPRGSHTLKEGDSLTIIGDKSAIKKYRDQIESIELID